MPLGKRTSSPAIRQTPAATEAPSKIEPSSSADLQECTMFRAEEPQFHFCDIVLNQDTYNAIQDVLVLYEKHDLLFKQWGLESTHRQQNRFGINLYGFSGTGKSMAAHAIANQLGRKILTVDYSQIESKYVGETSKNLVALFACAKESGAVIFFDEADALLSRREPICPIPPM